MKYDFILSKKYRERFNLFPFDPDLHSPKKLDADRLLPKSLNLDPH
jgi:hypothetical protein